MGYRFHASNHLGEPLVICVEIIGLLRPTDYAPEWIFGGKLDEVKLQRNRACLLVEALLDGR